MKTAKKHYSDHEQHCETDERHKMIGKPSPEQTFESRFNGTRADDLQVGGDHYKEMGVQPWAVMESVLTREEFIGFLKGNIIKYSMRIGRKESNDVGKCQHYQKKLDEVLGRIPFRHIP